VVTRCNNNDDKSNKILTRHDRTANSENEITNEKEKKQNMCINKERNEEFKFNSFKAKHQNETEYEIDWLNSRIV